MSKKATIDMLGEAHLPEDFFTPTEASTFGLNSVGLECGMGVLDGDTYSGKGPESGVPGTLAADQDPHTFWDDDDEDGMDLGAFLETKEAGLSDLDWLDLAEQDPERLPEDPHDMAIPELEEAWGVNRRTDGVHLYAHNIDLDTARYQASLENPEPESFQYTAADLQKVVLQAHRQSAAGLPLENILRHAAESLGDEAFRIKADMAQVKAEYGLAGKVFIRASAYPGLHQRPKDWAPILRRASGARYILYTADQIKSAVFIQGGYCTLTKKRAVTEVPWDDAFKYYAPTLVASGRKVASGVHPAIALRRAFLSQASKLVKPASHLPTHVTPSERVTLEAARKAFAAMPHPERKVYDHSAKRAAQDARAAQLRIVKWARGGLIDREPATAIVQSGKTASEMTLEAVQHIMRVKGVVAYSGMVNDIRPADATDAEVRDFLANWQPPAPIDISHRRVQADHKRAALRIAKWVRAGLLSREDGVRLVQSQAQPREMLRAAGALITASQGTAAYSGLDNDVRELVAENVTREEALSMLAAAEQKQKAAQAAVDKTVADRAAASRYRGAERETEALRPHLAKVIKAVRSGVKGNLLREFIARTIPADRRKLATKLLAPFLAKTGALDNADKTARTYEGAVQRPVQQRVASVSPPRAGEIAALMRWARQMMNEGEAGKGLDVLIRAKFGQAVRTAASGTLQKLRADHEGAAGYIYVDAEAYASKTGTAGCDKGATRHRANQLKYVLSMDRCATCTQHRVKADGTPRCSMYNKELVADEQIPHKRLMQATNIEQAARPDYELTASMFAPTYDPSEFDLHNANMDDIDFEHSSTSTEELSQILFGGMEWET